MPWIPIAKFGTAENYALVKSDNPVQRLWVEIGLLRDEKYLETHGVTEEGIRTYVSTLVAQAEDYWQAYQSATLYTRPLLLYYSLNALTKAVIALKTDRTNLSGHGLRETRTDSDILDLRAKTARNGLFVELCNISGSECEEGQEISLKIICDGAIELQSISERYFGINPRLLPFKVERFSDYHAIFRVNPDQLCKFPQIHDEIARIPEFGDFFHAKEDAQGMYYEFNFPTHKADEVINRFFQYSIYCDHTSYLDLRPQAGKPLSQPALLLAASFLLGSLVRYFPSELRRFTQDGPDSVRWGVEQMCYQISRALPNRLINLLHKQPLKFVTGL